MKVAVDDLGTSVEKVSADMLGQPLCVGALSYFKNVSLQATIHSE